MELKRFGLAFAMFFAVTQFVACGSENGGDGDTTTLTIGDPDSCKTIIADKDAKKSEIAEICEGAGINLELVAEIRLLVEELDSVLSALSALAGAPSFSPALDARNIIESALSKIIAKLERVSDLSEELSAESYADVAVEIESLPVSVDLGILGDFPKLEADLGGEWTRIPFNAVGAGSAGILAIVNFLIAHSIDIDIDEIGDLIDDVSSGGIATFLANNPELVTFAAGKEALFDKVKPNTLTALALLVGEAGASTGQAGLLAVADEQINEDPDQSNNLVVIIDEGDKKFGKGDKIDLPFIREAVNAISDADLKTAGIDDPATFKSDLKAVENKYIGRATLEDLVGLGQAVNANIKGSTSGPISLLTYLDAAEDDLRAYLDTTDLKGLEFESPKDWLAIDPVKFFDAKKPLRAFLPMIYAVNVVDVSTGSSPVYEYASGVSLDGWLNYTITDEDGEDASEADIVDDNIDYVRWEVMLECELAHTPEQYANIGNDAISGVDSIIRYLCGYGVDSGAEDAKKARTAKLTHKFTSLSDGTSSDWGHFKGQLKGDDLWASAGISDPANTANDASDDIRYVDEVTIVSTEAATAAALWWTDGFVAASGMSDGYKALAAEVKDGDLAADGKSPTGTGDNEVSILPYIAFQSPSAYGVLHIATDIDAPTGDFAVAKHGSFNATLAEIMLSYGPPVLEALSILGD